MKRIETTRFARGVRALWVGARGPELFGRTDSEYRWCMPEQSRALVDPTPPPKGLRATCGVIDGQTILVISQPADDDASGWPELTPSQREVARLLAAGWSNGEVAALRGTSKTTVARQVVDLYRRLAIGSRTELVALMLKRRPRR
jgi:DNA-binding NarL/FixJ family response regulator